MHPDSTPQGQRQSLRTPNHGSCATCGNSLLGKRPGARYCSDHCYNIRRRNPDTERACKFCGTSFPLKDRSDANRQYCSSACAKAQCAKTVRGWKVARPGYMRPYNDNRVTKNPEVWREKQRRDRARQLELLGGKCIVCGVTNPNWLHIDYVPTTRNTPYRHGRGLAFIRRNIHLFRLLCANHHYELTLTGRIEGTDITQ